MDDFPLCSLRRWEILGVFREIRELWELREIREI